MPQIMVIVGPKAREALAGKEVRRELDGALTQTVEKIFRIGGRDDVAFDIVLADHTRGEAPVQIEVHYTAGTDEYGKGVFDPSPLLQQTLARSLQDVAVEMLRLSVSVWVIPVRGSVFLPENPKDPRVVLAEMAG